MTFATPRAYLDLRGVWAECPLLSLDPAGHPMQRGIVGGAFHEWPLKALPACFDLNHHTLHTFIADETGSSDCSTAPVAETDYAVAAETTEPDRAARRCRRAGT